MTGVAIVFAVALVVGLLVGLRMQWEAGFPGLLIALGVFAWTAVVGLIVYALAHFAVKYW